MKKLLATLICLVMIVSVMVVFTACGGSGSDNDSDIQNNGQNNEQNNEQNNGDEQVNEKEEVAINEEKGNALPSKLVANKIASIDKTRILIYDGGYLYGEGEKIGISSFDGKQNSGAIYTSAKGMGNYFVVATQEVNVDANNPTSLNAFGLVDASGKVIVPCEYSSLSILNERYVWVCNVSELTDDKDNAVTYMSKSGSFSLYPKDDDYFFKGQWFIYDVQTGEKVEGVTGTKPDRPRVKGPIITYKNDAGTEFTVNEKGQAMPADANILANGMYVLEGKAYTSDGKEMFAFKKDGFEATRVTDDGKYFIASKYVDYESRYAVMDMTGKLVSAEFDDSIYVYGLLIEKDDMLYNFKGEQVVEGEFDSVYYTRCADIDVYFLEKDDVTTVLDGAFNVIYQGELTDNMRDYKTSATIQQTIDKVDTCYNYTTKAFDVDGYTNGFLVTVSGKYPAYTLKEVVSGSSLIENSTGLTVKDGNGIIYVVSQTASGHDFYTVNAG